jgi:hypothetical protein
MEECRMRNNPFPDETTKAQQAHPQPQMEDLQPRPAPPAPPPVAAASERASEIESVERQEEARTVRYAIGKLNDFLRWFIAVLEVTLALRFLLKLIGADPTNLFAGFLFALTDIILFPFSTIVRNPSSTHSFQVFEWSTLIAMGIYYLFLWAITRFLRILISGPEEAS